ncbi:unnamed protein product [Ambrosiozyma monospora]|uniref:Unnamed protein product n=1 Tax=Ambrosiozyma monospora TaxID=43982 RepID=A0A9W6YVC5_AMBMO|nr:unnamed protein product [Ambrosiozyma monospora]
MQRSSQLNALAGDEDGRIQLNKNFENAKEIELTDIPQNYIDSQDIEYEDDSDYSDSYSLDQTYSHEDGLNDGDDGAESGLKEDDDGNGDDDLTSSDDYSISITCSSNAVHDDLVDLGDIEEGNTSIAEVDTGKEVASRVKPAIQTSDSYDNRGRPSACVFVASLSSSLSDDVLCQSVTNHFKQWGLISLVKVLRDPSNRPYAFVQYTNDSDANRAISEGQHSILNGRTVRCEKARVNRTLYVEMSSGGLTQPAIHQLLSKYGEIERMVAVGEDFSTIDSIGVQSRWFCKYAFRQDAISAFANLKVKPYWNIEWAQNLEDEYNNVPEVSIDRYSIFIGHLDPRISKDELVERFEMHGQIKEAILVNRPLNNFAFIKFKTKEAAASAVERENHSMFKFKTIHVQYREMYNNYKKKFSSETTKSQILNLAPPPVNFKRRQSRINHDKNFKQRDKGFNFGNFSDRQGSSEIGNSMNKPFAHSKHFSFSKRLGSSGFGSRTANGTKDGFQGVRGGQSKRPYTSNSPAGSRGNSSENKNNSAATAHSSRTAFSNIGPRSIYTYSSVDTSDVSQGAKSAPNLQQMRNYYQSQIPYYYVVPNKDAGYPNTPIPPQSMSEMVPPTNGYYFTYPMSAGSGMPPMYPMYMYYNPESVPRSHDGLPNTIPKQN